jgi:hypothetical protein
MRIVRGFAKAGASLHKSVFGAPIVLPNEFLQSDKFAVDSIIKVSKKQ